MKRIISKICAIAISANLPQFMKYVIVGFINTGIYYAVYYIMLKLGFFYVTAITIGTIVGTVNSYFWNKYFTFKSTKNSGGQKVKFLIVYGVQYLINLFVVYICVSHIGISVEFAGLFSIGIGLFISYFGHRYWSFRK